MSTWLDHLLVTPVVLPLLAAAAMLLVNERRRTLKAGISLGVATALLVISVILLQEAATGDAARVYRLGNWAAPFGIVLVADRLSTMMIALSSVLGLGVVIFSIARWDRAGPRFHALFLLLVMGVNGAFLTGDLFNLFVFFEVMLAASYGLVLHGSGEARIRAGLGYIAVNLIASLFFLVGVSLIYGVTGTLNMADLATRIAAIPAADRPLFEIGCAVLGVAFLIKASMWPLGFWLPGTYAAASAPAAAVFAILSKVGVYVVIRLSSLLFGVDAGASAGFGGTWLLVGGLATIVFGTAGILAARDLARAAGYAVMISSGTVLAAVGSGSVLALTGALFYLIGSTLGAAVLFLLTEVIERGRDRPPAPADAVFADEYLDPFEAGDVQETGLVIPAAVAVLGGAFLLLVMLLVGLPPLAGFIGKLAIFSGLAHGGGVLSFSSWMIVIALTLSSLGTLIALTRLGVAALWVPSEDEAPAIKAPEFVAIGALLAASLGLTLWGGPALIYTEQTAVSLTTPLDYIGVVLPERAR